MKEQMRLLWSDSLFMNLNSNVGVTVLFKTLIKYSLCFSDELRVKQIAWCLAQVREWINDCHLHWYLLSLFHSCPWVLCLCSLNHMAPSEFFLYLSPLSRLWPPPWCWREKCLAFCGLALGSVGTSMGWGTAGSCGEWQCTCVNWKSVWCHGNKGDQFHIYHPLLHSWDPQLDLREKSSLYIVTLH